MVGTDSSASDAAIDRSTSPTPDGATPDAAWRSDSAQEWDGDVPGPPQPRPSRPCRLASASSAEPSSLVGIGTSFADTLDSRRPFIHYVNGMNAEVVYGGQGAPMVQPSLRITGDSLSGTSVCAQIAIDNVIDGAAFPFLETLEFVAIAGGYESEPLLNAIGPSGANPSGKMLTLNVTVRGEHYVGQGSVMVAIN